MGRSGAATDSGSRSDSGQGQGQGQAWGQAQGLVFHEKLSTDLRTDPSAAAPVPQIFSDA